MPVEQVQTDVALIERVTARDPGAIAELYDRHGRLLYGLILRILGRPTEAEEVLEAVFVAAWTRTEIYDAGLGSPVGWLVRIARNRALDRRRADGMPPRAAEPMVSAPTPDAEETDPASAERRRRTAVALATLPPGQRELIEQAYYGGLTHLELAERYALPLDTVKTRIRAGMGRLRQQLDLRNVEQ